MSSAQELELDAQIDMNGRFVVLRLPSGVFFKGATALTFKHKATTSEAHFRRGIPRAELPVRTQKVLQNLDDLEGLEDSLRGIDVATFKLYFAPDKFSRCYAEDLKMCLVEAVQDAWKEAEGDTSEDTSTAQEPALVTS